MRENIMVTDYQLSRRERMREYLNSLREEALLSFLDTSAIDSAEEFLIILIDKLAQRNLVLEVPDCCPSSYDFHIMFTWTKDEHYLECEIFNNGDIEFFYRNRIIPSEGWGEDYTIGQTFSDELIDKLSLFVE